ncbi:MAG: hypothetical protein KC496_22485, partial [Anaerolineae bacterium]|nr:hypothetical protein [Anaerolineae bacterium]
IINSGTIRGDYSILATYAASSVRNPQEIVQNLAGGVLDGYDFLDIGDDQLLNNGQVIGDVDMGDGDDSFTGTGTVSGLVDMGFGNDSYIGSASANRAVGGRGNDTLAGRGGNDILVGGFGNDTLRGDAGNDTLLGEWGDDTIRTQSGDYVDAGSGNDVVILGDFTFEIAFGGSGTDRLVMAAGARNFDLSAMVNGARVQGFEVLELKADQDIIVDSDSIRKFTDGGSVMQILGAASNTLLLDGQWSHSTDVTIDGVAYQRWTSGTATVLASTAMVVQAHGAEVFGGWDAVAAGAAAPRPGDEAGLDYTNPIMALGQHLLFDDPFTVYPDEVFYADGRQVFISDGESLLTNYGQIYSLGDSYPASITIDFNGPGQLVNHGLIYVDQIAEFGSVYYYPSFAVRMGGSLDALPLENSGQIFAYSVPGSAIAVHNAASLHNTGSISAVSEHSRAIGVNAVYGSHIVDFTQTFYNSGTIYAEAGGPGAQVYVEGDRFVPAQYVATGVASWGSLVNDGHILAVLGSNADPALLTVGVYAMNFYGNSTQPANITNNGEIVGVRAIVFDDYGASVSSHQVTNNGLIRGDILFLGGNDIYDGSQGEMAGTVFGAGGNDRMTGGAFADTFNGGRGNDTLDGGGNIDTAIVSGNRSSYTVTQTSTGVFRVVGTDGTDTLTNIEYLQFADQTIRLLPGTGVSVNFDTADPSVYQSAMNAILDFDGNALGGNGSWLR